MIKNENVFALLKVVRTQSPDVDDASCSESDEKRFFRDFLYLQIINFTLQLETQHYATTRSLMFAFSHSQFSLSSSRVVESIENMKSLCLSLLCIEWRL